MIHTESQKTTHSLCNKSQSLSPTITDEEYRKLNQKQIQTKERDCQSNQHITDLALFATALSRHPISIQAQPRQIIQSNS